MPRLNSHLMAFAAISMVGVCFMPFLGATDSGYILVEGPHPEDPLQAYLYRLDNGLEVYLTINKERPRFFAEIAVRTGSKFDPPETTGLAHYMEHLLFKGSERLGTLDYEKEKVHLERIEALYEEHYAADGPKERRRIYEEITRESTLAAAYAIPNEFDRLYRAMGAREINAHTWHEEVVYKVDLPVNCLEHWARIESDRFAHPVFRLFQTELETVYEEMNRALDNKDRLIQNAVNARVFKRHPYGQQPTLGHVEDLKKPSIKRLNGFYDTWYRPGNMAIFISGDVDVEQTMSVIARHFSAWEPAALPESKTWEEDPLNGREELRIQYRAEPFVLLAFRTVKRNHEDAEALMMLDMILDNAVAGLINLNLNQGQKVREAGSYPLLLNDYGVQYLYGIPKEGQTLEEVERLLLDQIALIKKGAFEDWLIPAIINDYKKREKTAIESDASRVELMRRSWIGFESWEHAFRTIQRMEAVTREDVIRVANTYFGENYVCGFREDAPREPLHVEKPPLPEINIDPARQSAFATDVLARPLAPMEPVFLEPERDFRRIEDPAGIVFYHVPNPVNDVFNLSIIVDYGTRQDNRAALAARLFQRTGAGDMNAEALQIAWYKLGTDFSIAVEDNQMTITLKGLDEHLGDSLALLKEMLVHPVSDTQTLEELKKIILVQRIDAKKDPATIMDALSDYARYGEASPWLNMLPASEVNEISMVELQELMRTALGCRHYVLYTGSLASDDLISQYHNNRFHPDSLNDPPPYVNPAIREPENHELYLYNRGMAQSHIRLEFGGVPYTPLLSPASQLYNMYFAGSMSGIVFQELREVRALAYIVGARYRAGARIKDPNLMIGVIQTQADKTKEAVDAFIELMDNLPVSMDRYALAREALLNDYRTNRTGFRAVPRVLLDWERRGLEPDPRRQWYEEVLAATDTSLLESFHREHIAGRKKLISITGESGRLDLDALKAVAPVRAITAHDIFVE